MIIFRNFEPLKNNEIKNINSTNFTANVKKHLKRYNN